MEKQFEGLTVLDQRSEEDVLRETEGRLRDQVDAEGLQTIDGEDVAVHVLHHPVQDTDSREDFEEYLERCAGLQGVKVAVYAEGRGDRSREVAEAVDGRLDLEGNKFVEAYSVLEEGSDVQNAGFCVAGYGEDVMEAYRSAVPVVNFELDYAGSDIDVTVSRRDGGVIETFSGDAEAFREVYEDLVKLGLSYDGMAFEGEESAEWMVVDYGAVNTEDRR